MFKIIQIKCSTCNKNLNKRFISVYNINKPTTQDICIECTKKNSIGNEEIYVVSYMQATGVRKTFAIKNNGAYLVLTNSGLTTRLLSGSIMCIKPVPNNSIESHLPATINYLKLLRVGNFRLLLSCLNDYVPMSKMP